LYFSFHSFPDCSYYLSVCFSECWLVTSNNWLPVEIWFKWNEKFEMWVVTFSLLCCVEVLPLNVSVWKQSCT
jgi:NADH:ubiquinone oxidoreductase subunit B-like Fe-S oxidoreductase